MEAERWSDGPPLLSDLLLLYGVVDHLLGRALEEMQRKSN